jgi:hypothetical protein
LHTDRSPDISDAYSTLPHFATGRSWLLLKPIAPALRPFKAVESDDCTRRALSYVGYGMVKLRCNRFSNEKITSGDYVCARNDSISQDFAQIRCILNDLCASFMAFGNLAWIKLKGLERKPNHR